MAIKILATGDIHIGKVSSSVRGDSSEIATKNTWLTIVDYAIENNIDVVALTGDIVDKDNRYYEAVGPLQNGFSKLREAKIPVYLVAGNHDFNVLPQLIRSEAIQDVHYLGDKGAWEAMTFSKNNQTIQFIGWSFPTMHFSNNPMESFDSTIVNPSNVSIGLVHGDVGSIESQYAPMSLSDFSSTKVDVWLLGHIHKPEILKQNDPIVYYPGSPHALSPKEQGAHGPILLTVHSKHNIETKQISLSPVRYELLEIDVTGQEDQEAVRNIVTASLNKHAQSIIEELYNVRHLVYDLIFTGKHKSIEEIKSWVSTSIETLLNVNDTNTEITVRKTQINIEPTIENMEELAKSSTVVGVLAQSILALQNEETTPFLDQLKADWGNIENIRSAAVYSPLGRDDKVTIDKEEEAKQHLLRECNRILAELLNQQQ